MPQKTNIDPEPCCPVNTMQFNIISTKKFAVEDLNGNTLFICVAGVARSILL